MQAIHALAWHDTFSGLQARGFGFFDFITAIDQGEQLMVIARVANPESREAVLLWTTVRREVVVLDSLSNLYKGATWHERETMEMFGIVSEGLADTSAPCACAPGRNR